LSQITQEFIGERVGEQITAIDALRARTPHSIRLVSAAVPGDRATFGFTCFQYAFALVDPPPAIVTIATLYPHVFPSREFVEFLIRNALVEVTEDLVQDGDSIVYADQGIIRHAGVMKRGRVQSKWGTAHLWEHGVLEVPVEYGSELRFFRPISTGEAQFAFLVYAEELLGRNVMMRLFPETDAPPAT
jgi:hypothetical protein